MHVPDSAGAARTEGRAESSTTPATIHSSMAAMYRRHRLDASHSTSHALPHATAYMRCRQGAFRSHRKQTSCAATPNQSPGRRRALVSGGAAAVLGVLSSLPQLAAAAGYQSCIAVHPLDQRCGGAHHVNSEQERSIYFRRVVSRRRSAKAHGPDGAADDGARQGRLPGEAVLRYRQLLA